MSVCFLRSSDSKGGRRCEFAIKKEVGVFCSIISDCCFVRLIYRFFLSRFSSFSVSVKKEYNFRLFLRIVFKQNRWRFCIKNFSRFNKRKYVVSRENHPIFQQKRLQNSAESAAFSPFRWLPTRLFSRCRSLFCKDILLFRRSFSCFASFVFRPKIRKGTENRACLEPIQK